MFELDKYIPEIQQMAAERKVAPDEALEMFVTNLIVMRPHFSGATNVDFHTEGQKWNKLLSDQKVQQKAKVAELLKKPVRRRTEV